MSQLSNAYRFLFKRCPCNALELLEIMHGGQITEYQFTNHLFAKITLIFIDIMNF